jgi:hypothetical protein
MSKNSPYPEFDLLLPSIGAVSADLALNLLRTNAIPGVLRGPDFDVAELGTEAHRALRRQDLFVPRGARAQARSILVEAWGEAVVAAHEAGLPPPQELGD